MLVSIKIGTGFFVRGKPFRITKQTTSACVPFYSKCDTQQILFPRKSTQNVLTVLDIDLFA